MLKVAYHPIYVHPVPENHRFPMEKYELLVQQLLYEGTITTEQLHKPNPIEEDTILLTHCKDYWNNLKKLQLTPRQQRVSGFVHNDSLILRERIITQGTLDIALHALEHGIGFNIAGGTHHAYTDKAEGFCLLNDFAVASNYLLTQKLIKTALIIDLDVHQGNGTAEIFANEERVFTFSMHGKHNYPLHKETSDLDIHLETDTKDEVYLALLNSSLESIYKKSKPDIIFYQSGVDVLETDKLGHLSLSIEGCKERDRLVFDFANSIDTPICIAMGGGYSKDLRIILKAHANTFRIAESIFG